MNIYYVRMSSFSLHFETMCCLSSPFPGTPRSSRPSWSSRKNVQAEWSKFTFLDLCFACRHFQGWWILWWWWPVSYVRWTKYIKRISKDPETSFMDNYYYCRPHLLNITEHYLQLIFQTHYKLAYALSVTRLSVQTSSTPHCLTCCSKCDDALLLWISKTVFPVRPRPHCKKGRVSQSLIGLFHFEIGPSCGSVGVWV